MTGPSDSVIAGLDPAISIPHQIANDAIPVSNDPMETAGAYPHMAVLALAIIR
jgi:hypothetical protein